MVLKKFAKILLLIFIAIFIIFSMYIIFFDSADEKIGNILDNGLFGSDEVNDIPSPSVRANGLGNFTGGGGSGGGSSSGSGSAMPGGEGNTNQGASLEGLESCFIEEDYLVNGNTPCRCGSSAVCYEAGQRCDPAYNNEEGSCE